MKIRPPDGFTLMELVIVIFVLQLVIVPLYVAFSGSRKMMVNARDLTKAVSLGSSMIAGLRQVDVQTLTEFPLTSDHTLPENVSLAKIGLSKTPEGFQRYLAIELVDKPGQDGGPYYEARVEMRWKNSKAPGSPELKLAMKGLLGEKIP